MLSWVIEAVLDAFAHKVTDPGSPATRAVDAYESATVLMTDGADPNEVLTAQLDRYKVAEQYADPESVIGQQLFESFRSGVKPRRVKRWLRGLETD